MLAQEAEGVKVVEGHRTVQKSETREQNAEMGERDREI
jgi:hypothetical protein